MMSRRTSRQSHQGSTTRRKAQIIIVVVVVVSLFAAWTMLASSGAFDSALRQKGTKDGTVSLANFTSPSKEYVYAGGRLVATEEPSTGGPLHHASTIGVYRPSTAYFFLRNNTAGVPDISVPLGVSTDVPVVGDWDGNGTFTIGVFRASNNTFYLSNNNATGSVEITASLGAPGDLPVVGDWDGNGTTTIGVFRPTSNTFFLKNTFVGENVDITCSLGAAGDLPIAGDWNGDGVTTTNGDDGFCCFSHLALDLRGVRDFTDWQPIIRPSVRESILPWQEKDRILIIMGKAPARPTIAALRCAGERIWRGGE